jgi:nucleoside-diphosphate-sugar epimerase
MARVALVTGATGFMARHLVPALTERGWEIRATGRRPRPGWLPPGVAYEPADLAADDDLASVCRGLDCIVHLAGATSSLSSAEEMHRSNVVATTNLVAAARREGVGRLVHMSSTSIYGEETPLPQPLVETVEPHPSRGYGKAKWLAEQAVWAGHAEGLPAVVLRPVSVFGPRAIKLLASAALDVAIERFAARRSLQVSATPVELRLVHVADVVGAACHLAEAGAESVCGRAYNVVASSYPTSVELAGMLAGALGISMEESPDPTCGMGLDERRAAWQAMVDAGMEPSILFTEERFRFLKKANRNNRLSVDALLATGFRFSYGGEADLAAGVAETVDWYRDRRWIL